MEDDGTVTIMITLSQVSSVPFQVMVDTMDVTSVGEWMATRGLCIHAMKL